jgi:hypothetical protein
MAYRQDLKNAARRHLKAAQVLFTHSDAGAQPGCKAVAGYLFGLAGELALKQLMRESGVLPAESRRDDPYFAHFPELKAMLSTAQGRRAGELMRLSKDPRLFRNWDTAMRYAPTVDIQQAWVEDWKKAAEDLIARMAIA